MLWKRDAVQNKARNRRLENSVWNEARRNDTSAIDEQKRTRAQYSTPLHGMEEDEEVKEISLNMPPKEKNKKQKKTWLGYYRSPNEFYSLYKYNIYHFEKEKKSTLNV